MKRPWEVQRTTIKQLDGQRRWDIAYQHLLQWTSEVEAMPREGPADIIPQEEKDEDRHLRSRLNLTATTEPNH